MKNPLYREVKVPSPIFSVRQLTALGRIVMALLMLSIIPVHIVYGAYVYMKENTLADFFYCWKCIRYGNDRKIKIKKP